MLKGGEVHVWRVWLDELRPERLAQPTIGENSRAAGFHAEEVRRRYLRAHGALRSILGGLTGARLDFALAEKGKPYLPAAPGVRFNLSRSSGCALVAVSLEVDVGVDVERLRAVPEYVAIANRFFPPSEAAPVDERDFFRRWTRIEAMLKARGIGLYGAGAELEGKWTVQEIDAGEGYAAAVAAAAEGLEVRVHDFR